MVWLKLLVFCVLLVGLGATQNTDEWFKAAESGDSVKMEKYLSSKYWKNISMTDNVGNTALHRAVKAASDTNNVTKVVKLLIDAGINVNSQDNTGQTALFAAASKLDQELVQQLIAAGADIEIKDLWGHTAFQWSACRHERKGNSTIHEIVRTPSIFSPQISDWTATESCSCACGPGTRTETRSCTYYVDTGEGTYNRYVETKNNDNPCGAVLSRKTSCHEKTCIINWIEVDMRNKQYAESYDKVTYVAWYESTKCTISKLYHDDIKSRYQTGWSYTFDNSQSSPSFPLSCPSLCLPQLDSVLTHIEVENRGTDGFLYNTIDMAVNGLISRVYNTGTYIEYDPGENAYNPSYKKSAYRP